MVFRLLLLNVLLNERLRSVLKPFIMEEDKGLSNKNGLVQRDTKKCEKIKIYSELINKGQDLIDQQMEVATNCFKEALVLPTEEKVRWAHEKYALQICRNLSAKMDNTLTKMMQNNEKSAILNNHRHRIRNYPLQVAAAWSALVCGFVSWVREKFVQSENAEKKLTDKIGFFFQQYQPKTASRQYLINARVNLKKWHDEISQASEKIPVLSLLNN